MSKFKYLTSLGTIILTGIISWKLRIVLLNHEIKTLNSFDLGEGVHQTLAFDTLNFSLYLLIGLIIGGIISIPILKGRSTFIKSKRLK